jgi:hypothetical protein
MSQPQVGDGEICGHKFILYLRSDYFKKMVAVRMVEQTSNEIEIKECRLPVFEIVLRFLYGGQVELCIDTAQEVLMAAERFQIVELKRVAEAYFSRQLDSANALDMRTLAHHANSPALEQACTHYILQHLSSVVAEQQQQQQRRRRQQQQQHHQQHQQQRQQRQQHQQQHPAQQRSTGSSSTESSVVIGAGQQLMVQRSDREATRESSDWVSLVAAFFAVLTSAN